MQRSGRTQREQVLASRIEGLDANPAPDCAVLADKHIVAKTVPASLARRTARRVSLGAASIAVVTGGIVINLTILTDGSWGPGGLTLGASGVARADAAPLRIDTTATSSAPRTTTSARHATSTTAPAEQRAIQRITFETPNSFPQQPDRGGALTPPATNPRPPSTSTTTRPAPPETSPSPPTSSTTQTPTTDPHSPIPMQHYAVSNGANVSVSSPDGVTVSVVATVRYGWHVDHKTASGTEVRMRFENVNWIVEWRVSIDHGKLQRTIKRIPKDD